MLDVTIIKRFGGWLLAVYCIVSLAFAAFVYSSLVPNFNDISFFVPVEHSREVMKDFVWIYSGAVMASECGPDRDLYDFKHQTAVINRVISPFEIQHPMVLEYPPWFFSMLRPLSSLSLRAAYIFWCSFSFLLLLISLVLLGRIAEFGIKEMLVAISLAVVSPPTYYLLQNAQTTAVSLLLLAMFWFALCYKRYFWTGVIGALATVKPQFSLLPILIGASTLKRSYLYGFIIGLVLLIIPVCILYGPQSLVSWIVAIREGESNPNFYANADLDLSTMWNLRGVLVSLSTSDSPTIRLIAVAVFLLMSLALLLCWWKRGRPIDKPDLCALASVSILISLVSAPHSWAYDYILLVIPGCLLWYWSGTDPRLPAFAKILIRAFILSFPVFSWTFFAFKIWQMKLEFWLAIGLIVFVTAQRVFLMHENLRHESNGL
jgi:hypothetical protein